MEYETALEGYLKKSGGREDGGCVEEPFFKCFDILYAEDL